MPTTQHGPASTSASELWSEFNHNRAPEVLLKAASRGFQSQEVRIQFLLATYLPLGTGCTTLG